MARSPAFPTVSNGLIIGPTGEVSGVQYGAPVISFDTTGDFICQNCTKTQGGEIKEYNDEAGDTVILVRKGDHREFSIDGIMAANVADKKMGDQFTLSLTIGGTTKVYKPRVQTWQKTLSNEDVAKISMTARTYPAVDGGSSCDAEYEAPTGS